MKTKLKIEIEITHISVGECNYEIRYKFRRNDGDWQRGKFDSDYDGQTAAEFIKVLQNGYACELVLERLT